jgi:DNA-binding MarR family transcriptional regulator
MADPAPIARAVLQLARRLRAERPVSSVSLSALGLLNTLHREGPMPAARLAEAERLQPQSLTRLIARLEAEGLVIRSRGETDRRTLLLAITPGGRAVIGPDMTARRAWLAAAMEAMLTVEEQADLARSAELMQRLASSPSP